MERCRGRVTPVCSDWARVRAIPVSTYHDEEREKPRSAAGDAGMVGISPTYSVGEL